ncbi:tetratricopeptide repeat protein [Clostridium sp.]|uniref:tetratricopeptide repeat protein n=1 Tax=Clostridium sp. TaxID=1506 RepID=UPI002613895E|nr:tetratricopeptide repeat protein [Clostridium sp.]
MWTILGINETKDKNEIKEAYMTKLQVINPEDDAEGFKRLRAAYEEALKFADTEDISEAEDNTPIGTWMKRVKITYNKFSLRIDEDAWRELLEDEVCFGIDSREEASNKLLEFLINYFSLPKKVWLLFDEYFSWSEKIEELYKYYPENFINYVSGRINPDYSDNLDYYSFDPIDDKKPYDEWISLFFKIQREIKSNNLEEAKRDLEQIYEYNINHPSLDYWHLRYYLITKELENARQLGEALVKKCPNEIFALYGIAEVEWLCKNYEEAAEYYKKCLEINPEDYNSKVGLADCYFETDNLDEAEKLFEKAGEINRYDDYVRERLFVIGDKRIAELEKKCEEEKDDKKLKFKLGWYYFNNGKNDELIKLCHSFTPDKEDVNQYYDLISRAYFSKNNYEEVLKYLDKWQANLEDETIENEYRQEELEMVYYQKGRTFSNQEAYESALEFYKKALELKEDKIFTLNNIGFVLNNLNRYEESLEILNKGLELNNDDVFLHMNKCETLFNLRYYKEAMEEGDIAISIYPYYTKPYLIKMKIYYIYEEYEEVLAIAKELEERDITDEETDIYKLRALSNTNKIEEAENLAINLLKEKKTKNIAAIQFELAIMKYNSNLYDKALVYVNKAIKNSEYEEEYLYFRAATYRYLRSYDLAIKDYETIINNKKYNPSYFPFLKLGQIYGEIKNYTEALHYYEEVLRLDPENPTVNNAMGEIYETLNDYDKALEHFTKQLEIEKSAYYYLNRGLFYARNEKFEEAEKDYRCAIELEPENPYPYNNLAYLYERKNEHEKAIPYYKKAIEVDNAKDDMRFYKNITACYKKIGENELAIEYYNKAIEDFRDEDELYYKKAKLLKNMKLYKDAIETYLKGIEIHKAQKETSVSILEDFYDEISSSYKSMEDYDNAIKWAEMVLEINPKTKYGFENMGRIYDDLKDYDTAIKYYKQQISVNSEKGVNYLLIAGAYKEQGKKLRARKYYKLALQKFLKVENKTPYEYSIIGNCYNGLEDTNKAFEYLNLALNSRLCENCNYKVCADGFFGLGEVYEREKAYEKALEYYKKAVAAGYESKSTREAIERVEKLLN